MAFDPSSAQLIQNDTQPSSSAPVSNSSSFDPNTASPIQDDSALSKINAVRGGIAQGITAIPEGVNNAITFTLKHIGLISPETADKLYAANKDLASGVANLKSDVFAQPMQDHPVYAAIGRIGTDIAGGLGAMKAAGTIGSLASGLSQTPAISTGAGVVGRALTSGLASTGMSDTQDQNQAFLGGAIGSPVADLANVGISSLGSKAKNIEDIQNILSNYSKDKVDQAYADIRNLDFKPEDSARINNIADQVKNTLAEHANNLTDPQTETLSNLNIDLSRTSSFDSALKTYQNLGKSIQKDFSGLKSNTPVFNALKDIRSSLGESINNSAAKQGIDDALSKASNLYATRLQTKKMFSGIQDIPNDLSYLSITKKLLSQASKYDELDGLKPTADTLRGLAKITQTMGNNSKLDALGNRLIGSAIGAGTGRAVGYQEGGKEGSAIGAVSGSALGFFGLSMARKLVNTSEGQAFLRSIAKPGFVKDNLNAITRGLAAAGASFYLESNKMPDEQ